jgi:hypothetical protein
VLNPVSFALSTYSTLSTLVSPLIGLSSKPPKPTRELSIVYSTWTPHFDGNDYSFWSHKMRSHLFSLHPSIREIVENGMHFDSSDNPVFINEQVHKNA